MAAGAFALAVSAIASDFETGRAQYQRTCAQCHGRNLVNSGVTVYDLRFNSLIVPREETFVIEFPAGSTVPRVP